MMRTGLALVAAFTLLLGSLTLNPRPTSAQEIEIAAEIETAIKTMPEILQNPIEMAAIRSLVATQLQYRIATNFLGYEREERFLGTWLRFNSVLFSEGFQKIVAMTEAGNATYSPDLLKASEAAFANNSANYDAFLGDLIRDTYGIDAKDTMKARFRGAMLKYTLMNTALADTDGDRNWFDESWVWPFCEPRQ